MTDESIKLKHKSFNSLLRGGVKPTNTLTKVSPTSIIAKAESTRKRLDVLNSDIKPIRPISHITSNSNSSINSVSNSISDSSINSSINSNPSSSPIKSVISSDGTPITSTTDENNSLVHLPVVTLPLRSLWFDKLNKKAVNSSLEINISKDNKFIYFTQNSVPIPKLTINKSQIRRLGLSENSIIIQLQDKTTILANHVGRDDDIRDYFRSHRSWNVDTNSNISQDYVNKLKAKLRLRQDPVSSIDSSSPHSHSRSSPISYSRTRSKFRLENGENSASPIDIADTEFSFVPRQTPAKFTPDLHYKFADKKSFTLTYSDFKTLYNNDWINDSMIDFFIQFEIQSAIEKGLFSQEQIYAFNSFFFTKLMTKSSKSEKPNYYENIKRWVTKIDIMKIPYVIIPINEQSHWYCCIIRGLPDLLNYVQSNQLNVSEAENTPENKTLEPGKSPEASTNTGVDGVSVAKKCADIFVFDSLAHKHSNISLPLKTFIIDYCKHAYGVEVEKNLIRVQSARVPIQNNFNDCGIHVIYNVRKWLYHTNEIEKMWKGTYLKQNARVIFNAEERNGMRKQLIDILLKLHKNQDTDHVKSASDADVEGDDDIEVIEFNEETNPFLERTSTSESPSKQISETLDSKAESTGEENLTQMAADDVPQENAHKTNLSLEGSSQEKSLQEDTKDALKADIDDSETSESDTPDRSFLDNFMGINGKSDVDDTPTRITYSTLDPRAQSLKESTLINESLQKLFPEPLSKHLVQELNALFGKKNIIVNQEQTELIKNYFQEVNVLNDAQHIDTCTEKLKDQLRQLSTTKPGRPRDEVLQINHTLHTSDVSEFMDSEEINASVNAVSNLQISTRETIERIFDSDSSDDKPKDILPTGNENAEADPKFRFETTSEPSPHEMPDMIKAKVNDCNSPEIIDGDLIPSPKHNMIQSSTPKACSSKRRRVI